MCRFFFPTMRRGLLRSSRSRHCNGWRNRRDHRTRETKSGLHVAEDAPEGHHDEQCDHTPDHEGLSRFLCGFIACARDVLDQSPEEHEDCEHDHDRNELIDESAECCDSGLKRCRCECSERTEKQCTCNDILHILKLWINC